ncbi:GlxA family transcriptional regulator [Phaeobacter marinintestinus]|uniref:GlxA family transcriptional regulator n=1 Tax=Falsiphaeobacter marinintestinus TaxID=1492905 RepID=UPI0011B6433D|nr:GlxA family transcriptional regulator [Phaeobacter marinintestinus]
MTESAIFRVGFLVFPGFPMACLTSAIEPLRAANEIAETNAFEWRVLSETGDAVTASADVVFQPDQALQDAEGLDLLFLLSSPQGTFANPRTGNGRLRHLVRHGTDIGAVSGGVFPLAASGLLQDRIGSVHWCYKSAFQSEYPDLHTSDDVIVVDRGCFTASGAAAVFDLMLRLIEQRLDGAVMTEVACWFQHPLVRTEGVSQSVPAFKTDGLACDLPDTVARAIDVFSKNLEDPLGIGDVADQIGVSPRQMERSFRQALDQSPLQYYRTLRMNAARQMVLYSRESLTEIAQAVGYVSSSTLSKHYRSAFGMTPQDERRRANRFRVEENRPVPSV